jgi:hypothetical protein
MKPIENKSKEEIIVITKPEELSLYSKYYLAERAIKGWSEDFVDDDTGEVVTIQRSEVMFEKGTSVLDTFDSISFHFTSGEIKELKLSNQQRLGTEVYDTTETFYAVIETNQAKKKKKKILLHSNSIKNALACVTDFCEIEVPGSFNFSSIKKYAIRTIINDPLSKVGTTEDQKEESKYYHISFIYSYDDASFNDSAIVYCSSLDIAKAVIVKYINEIRTDETHEFFIEVEEATILKVDYYIDDEFSNAYNDNVE